ncbi:MAG TPA: DUF2520 domain-containing protein [Candidatus Kapabacteria bacterium]|nr:DUF2520 domain-containing protein [Candidatus Kapabacteria bacterium]
MPTASPKKYIVTIIGAGRAGSTVGRALRGAGYPIACVVSHNERSARTLAKELRAPVASTELHGIPSQSNFILISTGDDAIAGVARDLAKTRSNFRETVIVHLSAALTRDVLAPLHKKGAMTLALHPAFPFASRNVPASRLRNIGWAVECTPKDFGLATKIVESLHGVPVRIPPKNKILYHAGCSVASNFLVVLIDAATQLFREAGLSPRDADKLLQPLIAETLNNVWSDPGIPINKKLTGPIARGDAGTLQKHLRALKKFGGIEQMFRALSRSAFAIAKKNKNIPAAKLNALKSVIEED